MNNNLLGNYISFETFLKNYISEHGERIEDYRKRILKEGEQWRKPKY